MKNSKIILAGFGGQGILFSGKVLAYAGLKAEREVSWLPSYGPEMRGGTANCHVVISDSPVGSPIIRKPDILMVMNRPSLDKFEDEVETGGFIVVDSSLLDREMIRDDVNIIKIPATELSLQGDLEGFANMVMVGKLIQATGLFTLEEIEQGLNKSVPPSKSALLAKNIQAIKMGYSYEGV